MNHSYYLNAYLSKIGDDKIKKSISDTVEEVKRNYIEKLSNKHTTGLLLGEVQSGKTSQILGIISAAADVGFRMFIFLTTDNVYLQQQTYERALKGLTEFVVCNENDEILFNTTKLSKPTIIILKKNSNVLKTWKNNISSSKYCEGRSIFIVDDEGDASSMNTLVNKNKLSTIHKHLTEIRHIATSSIFLQVTATPQAIILQSQKFSDLTPSFIHYFKPGHGYMGGNFFFSDPKSYVIKLTDEEELTSIKNEDEYIPTGLQEAILYFLVVGSHLMLSKESVCNFLIHPSSKIRDHESVAEKIGEFLNTLLLPDTDYESQLKRVWYDLQKSKPDIKPFDEIKDYIQLLLSETCIQDQGNNIVRIATMNSKSSQSLKFDKGLNIIVGGNSLGRGVTFEGLQIVYYSRTAKIPQMDTYWQHCRMFGYNRDRGLIRVFMPFLLWTLFQNLQKSNQALIHQVVSNGINAIKLLVYKGTRATRPSVVRKDQVSSLAGGVNYFPAYPKNSDVKLIDNLLAKYDEQNYYEVPIEELIDILRYTTSENKEEWDNESIISCLQGLSKTVKKGKLIVRRERDISRGTGTLLSPNDRILGQRFSAEPVLTMYRIIGAKQKGWNNAPIWIPNIKFPNDVIFCSIN